MEVASLRFLRIVLTGGAVSSVVDSASDSVNDVLELVLVPRVLPDFNE